MGRKDPAVERSRRALDDLDKGLRRGDMTLALEAATKVRADLPEGAATRLGVALRRGIAEAHRAGQWGRLHALAGQALLVPAVLAAGGASAEECDSARWALFWGCVRNRDPRRAREYLSALSPALQARDRLWSFLTDVIDREGVPSPAALAALPASLREGSDPRLGHDAPRARALPIPRPSSVAAARDSVYLALATRPFPDWAALIDRWIAEAEADAISADIRAHARTLAFRELVLRARAGTRLAEPVRLLVRLLRGCPEHAAAQAGAGPSLPEVLRVVLGRPKPFDQLDADPDGLLVLCRALLTDDCWSSEMAGFLRTATALLPPPRAASGQLRLYQTWLDARPGDLETWAMVALGTSATDDLAPDWLWPPFERMLKEDAAIGQRFSALSSEIRDPLMRMLREELPLHAGLALVERAWPTADGTVKLSLAHIAGSLTDQVLHEAVSGPDFSADFDDPGSAEAARALMERGFDQVVRGPVRALWKRLARELLAVEPALVDLFIDTVGGTVAGQQEALAAVFDQKEEIAGWIDGLISLSHARSPHASALCDALFSRLIGRFGHDARALAVGLLRAERRSAPPPALTGLATALLAVAPSRQADRPVEIRQALTLARRLLKGRRSGRKPKTPRPRNISKRPRSPGAQLDFPL